MGNPYYGRGLRPERFFQPGQLVRFCPPPGAYSPKSAQAVQAGQAGLIVSAWSDDYRFVTFGEGVAILINSAYLKEEHHVR